VYDIKHGTAITGGFRVRCLVLDICGY
jgi:hypothetical protein